MNKKTTYLKHYRMNCATRYDASDENHESFIERTLWHLPLIEELSFRQFNPPFGQDILSDFFHRPGERPSNALSFASSLRIVVDPPSPIP
jgi:hypothetical protein